MNLGSTLRLLTNSGYGELNKVIMKFLIQNIKKNGFN